MLKLRHAVMGWVFEEVGKRVVRKKIAQKRQELVESKVSTELPEDDLFAGVEKPL